MKSFLTQMLSGDRLALSRLISHVESRSPDLVRIMSEIQKRCGRATTIGITGPPGAGKSTLVDKLISHFRKAHETVGVLAIDPSSPFSGGAVLGDRIRMQDHTGDEGVFIRSLGSRGSHGGLSRATHEIAKLFDAYGMHNIIIETVGVGQTELDIMNIADTTVVILTPESGDTIQTMKAGILEIADIFVVNKADRDGAERIQAELKVMVEIGGKKDDWQVPVLLVQATQGRGVEELLQAIQSHRNFLKSSSRSLDRRKKQMFLLNEAVEIAAETLRHELQSQLKKHGTQKELGNPYQLAQVILKHLYLPKFSGTSTKLPRCKAPTKPRLRRTS